MKAEEFAKFVEMAKRMRGWSEREVSRRLQCGVNQVSRWKMKDSPAYIGLACTALSEGLEEWTYETGGLPEDRR